MPAPDPDRLGGWGWVNRTKGRLTRGERLKLSRHIAKGQAQRVLSLLRRPDSAKLHPELPEPPDSALSAAAMDALSDVSPEIVGHSLRTWLYGEALAQIDGSSPDREVLYVASLLHDVGLMQAVAGEDFTIRSGRAAIACCRETGSSAAEDIADAISIHATPGITISRDGAPGFYVQAGALLDLGGLRAREVPASYRKSVLAAHDRTGLRADIVPRIRAEAAAVPGGRFALLKAWGFTLAITR